MPILVTGGAGYIGSVVAADLLARGENPVVIDNLSNGLRKNVPAGVPFYEGDIGNSEILARIFKDHEISACMHFSALAIVSESVEDPRQYYENNVVQTVSLLNSLIEADVRQFIFSSTCAVYGEPEYLPIDEKHALNPTNPYGWSKLMVEQILEDYSQAYDFRFVALRYFNASGATETIGEHHNPETHLIPLILDAAAGERDSISVFGDDYETPDGTAVRDYIHVSDLSEAHILALKHLSDGGGSEFLNLGNGDGYSVMEVVEAARSVTGKKIDTQITSRREGDSSSLVGDSTKARKLLGWEPKITGIEEIIESAWSYPGRTH